MDTVTAVVPIGFIFEKDERGRTVVRIPMSDNSTVTIAARVVEVDVAIEAPRLRLVDVRA